MLGGQFFARLDISRWAWARARAIARLLWKSLWWFLRLAWMMENMLCAFSLFIFSKVCVSLLLLFVALCGLTDTLLHCCQFKGSLYGCLWRGDERWYTSTAYPWPELWHYICFVQPREAFTAKGNKHTQIVNKFIHHFFSDGFKEDWKYHSNEEKINKQKYWIPYAEKSPTLFCKKVSFWQYTWLYMAHWF